MTDVEQPQASVEAPHLWRSPSLGEVRSAALDQGTIEYFRRGVGPTLVFAHGWLANANLWRTVVNQLACDYTCITLDLPLGGHRVAMDEHADLSPTGCGALIVDFLDAVDLDDVTLVGNDSGGAYSQIAAAQRPDRIAALVLNSCETPYDAFPPPPFDGLPQAAADAKILGQLLGALRDRTIRATPPAYGLLIKHPIDDLVSDSYALPALESELILRDTAKVMSSADAEPVHAAGERLIREYDRPVLFAWGTEDKVFALANAERYCSALANARMQLILDAYSFTPEDQPLVLAQAIAQFVPV
jgi:pimeloyl-ACP methyl ester carboxylesterase